MFFEYKGRKVSYSLSGAGSPVLLLHGWGCDGGIFRSFIPRLEEKHTVVSLDFPGFGQSEEPDGVWGVGDYADCVEALCDFLKLDNPYVVGHSFGGRVAVVLASRRPVARLVLTDAAGVKPVRTLKYYLKVYAYKFSKFVILKLLRSRELFEKYRAGKGSEDYRNASPLMKSILSKVVGEDLTHLMPSIGIPVLLFWGEKDTATPVRDAHVMEKLFPDCGLVIVPGAGHYSFLEAGGMFANVLDSFLV